VFTNEELESLRRFPEIGREERAANGRMKRQ